MSPKYCAHCLWGRQAELRFTRAWLRKLPWRQADRRGLSLEQLPQPAEFALSQNLLVQRASVRVAMVRWLKNQK